MYLVKITCAICGRDTTFAADTPTDKRQCPLCAKPTPRRRKK